MEVCPHEAVDELLRGGSHSATTLQHPAHPQAGAEAAGCAQQRQAQAPINQGIIIISISAFAFARRFTYSYSLLGLPPLLSLVSSFHQFFRSHRR